jgi:hypothetical protein
MQDKSEEMYDKIRFEIDKLSEKFDMEFRELRKVQNRIEVSIASKDHFIIKCDCRKKAE